jgi:uncharacterized protein (DUF302 family)
MTVMAVASTALAAVVASATAATSDNPMAKSSGVVTLTSPYTFDQTLARLRAAIATHGLALFLDLDQQAAAQKEGLTMPRAHLLLFGSPRAGTPVLRNVPEAGVDLPLKAYLWEAPDGGVFVSYSDPEYVAARHHLSAVLSAPLAGIVPLIAGALAH